MKLTEVNKKIITVICLLLIAVLSFGTGISIAHADQIALDEGVYKVPFSTNVSDNMGAKAFENSKKEIIVEKIGNLYFATVSFDGEVVRNITILSNEGKVGETVVFDGTIERHTYTLSKKNINSNMNFTVYIKAMGKEQALRVTPLLDQAEKISDEVDKTTERPAEFVPVIETVASDNELEKGSTYVIPEANATLGNKNLLLIISAYYLDKGEKVNLDTDSGTIILEKTGEYHVIYHAETDKYKTLLNNNSITELDIKIIVKVGATSIAKVEDKNSVLPEEYNFQSNYIREGNIFDVAETQMKKIADNFEVISYNFTDKSGVEIELDKTVYVYLKCNDAYNKNKVVVYNLGDDGSLTSIDCENFGRYVRIETDRTGNFVVCEPGVAFHMPMWGYAVITVVGVLLLTSAIVVPIIVVHKKKKAKKQQ